MANTPNLNLITFNDSDYVVKEPFNSNFLAIDNKFSPNGHKHTGTVGDGGKIDALNVQVSNPNLTSTNLADALNELFTDASSQFNNLATAAGVPSATSFQDVLNYINTNANAILNSLKQKVKTIGNTDNLQVAASKVNNITDLTPITTSDYYVAQGVTFLDSNKVQHTGKMPVKTDIIIDSTNNSSGRLTVPAGFYRKLNITGSYIPYGYNFSPSEVIPIKDSSGKIISYKINMYD